MTLSRRDLVSQATLVFYEFSLVPLSILATFFVLAFVGGVLGLAELAGQWLGIGSLALDGVTAFVVTLTFVAMASAGGTVVYGYQRFFDRSFGRLGPTLVLAVPLVGVVGSLTYALVHLRTLSPPWWVTLIVVMSVHSLAFRAIAVYSMLGGNRRSGPRIGIAAAVPVTAALVTLVTGHLLDAGWNQVGQRVAAVAATLNGPLDLVALVATPALIAAIYGYSCTGAGKDPLGLPELPIPTVPSRTVLDRLERIRPEFARESTGESTRSTDGNRRSRRGRPSGSPPPSSPDTGGSQRSRSSGSGTDGSGPERSVFRGGSGAAASERDDEPAPSGTSSSDAGVANDRQSDASASTDAPDPSPAAAEATAESDADGSGTGSDTRIFTDDFGQYGDGGATAETCPDCDAAIPSDGQYKFCPQCGGEL